ncbi:polyketide cyclase/dehydrase [Chryseobacterium tongliaoense]|uniref:polyketide cyclase/dehydrase n=1 Tax=Chryseobacterium tongliaoense TaxID=3240933 RepID=UPI0035143183
MKLILYCVLMMFGLIAVAVILLEVVFTTDTGLKSINNDAPVKICQEITIHAPSQKVYQMISDINHWEELNNDVIDPKLNGSFEEGNSFDWKNEGVSMHSIISNIIPGKKIGWCSKACGVFAINSWSFTSYGDYTTIKVEESTEGWLVFLRCSKFQKDSERSTRIWLKNLKTEAEKTRAEGYKKSSTK